MMQHIPPAHVQLEFNTVFTNAKAYLDKHNSCQSKLTDCLSSSHRATVFSIVRLFLKQLKKVTLV